MSKRRNKYNERKQVRIEDDIATALAVEADKNGRTFPGETNYRLRVSLTLPPKPKK